MAQVTINEAKSCLAELIQQAMVGEEIIITDGQQALVKLVVLPQARTQRHLGLYPDAIIHIADDFDEPLAEFAEYMKESHYDRTDNSTNPTGPGGECHQYPLPAHRPQNY